MLYCLPMVNCSYCGKEIKRLVFCNSSHKVMYHRKGKPLLKVIKEVQKEKKVEVCKHGMMFGLCKFGCK